MTDFVTRLGNELETLARESPSRETPPRTRLATHSVLKYATVEGAERYRRIMRVFYVEHRNFGLRLTPADVGRKLLEHYDLDLDDATLSQSLDQLHAWRAVSREYDTSLARTARELRQNRFTYDITQAATRVEALLDALDELSETVGALEGSRLPQIRDALHRIARLLGADAPNGKDLRTQFELLTGEVERLHAGASDFMRRLNEVIARSERIEHEEFERCKGVLIEHMQGFRNDLRRHTPEIEDALRTVDRLGAPRLATLIVSSLEIPALPGVDPQEVAARRHAELLDQWEGVRTWFVDAGGLRSPWAALNDKVVDAIRAVLDIAERIIDRRTNRLDRARACEHLARLVHDAPSEDEATAIVSAALGVATPRHVGAPEDDPDRLTAPAQMSWLTAPPAPVTAHLRRPGSRTPGAGRGTPIADTSAARKRMLERRRGEREELAAMLERFRGLGAIRLSQVATLSEIEFRHLLHWIGRAFETPKDAAGARRADSQDGRARIVLHLAEHSKQLVVLQVPQGRFRTPDYRIEVTAR
ncbi:MAG: TIGR02677 family protein [Gaiellaceae bacterium]